MMITRESMLGDFIQGFADHTAQRVLDHQIETQLWRCIVSTP
jgi:hypothetical protein